MGKTRKCRARENGGRAGKKGKGREREPVIISFTTSSSLLLPTFGCQAVDVLMSWNLSQISRASISRGENSLSRPPA